MYEEEVIHNGGEIINKMSNEYSAENIKVLDALEHMKQRRGMYLGDCNDARGLLNEIMDNAVDEVQAGFSCEIHIKVDTKSNTYTVRDFGRGIPHGKKKLDDGSEKEVLEVLLTVANSGGKFDNNSYQYSSGLNGLGLTITNALSLFINIKSIRKNKYVEAHGNGTKNVELFYGNTEEHDGTEVTFSPDPQYFKHKSIPIEYIQQRCKIYSALGFKSRLFIDNIEYPINASIFDLLEEENTNIHEYTKLPPFDITALNGEKMKVAIRYTSDTNDRYAGFTNLLPNTLGGTHVQELSRTIMQTWKEFIESHKNVKPAVDLKPNDYLVGLRAVCAIFIAKPEFSSQTKEKLVVNKKYLEDLMSLFKARFSRYLEDNIVIAQQLIKRFEEYRIAQNNLLSRKEISSLIKINTDSDDNIRRRSVVSKLVECTSRKKAGTELFIVEGDSAKGPYLFTRNKETQAVLPLRGKILNITNRSVKEAVKNNEICDIANSIGCGIGGACDASKSRYSRIIISADADPDGLQINCLVLSVFINMFPDLVKQGMVYVSMPPLYCWGKDEKSFGWCNKIEEVPKNVKEVHRFKGLGEMNDNELKYFLVDPDTRNLMQIQFPADVDEFNKILGTSEGKNNLLKTLGIIESN